MNDLCEVRLFFRYKNAMLGNPSISRLLAVCKSIINYIALHPFCRHNNKVASSVYYCLC